MESECIQILKDFRDALREAAGKVYHAQSLNQKVPLNDIVDAMVKASYLNLTHAIRTKLSLSGKIRATAYQKCPKELIEDVYRTALEVVNMVQQDLSGFDTKHEYAVGIVKRERRT